MKYLDMDRYRYLDMMKKTGQKCKNKAIKCMCVLKVKRGSIRGGAAGLQ
jgi:hypothetical protein